METSKKWLNNYTGSAVTQTGFSRSVVMTRPQLLQFAGVSNVITPSSLVFGDIQKWLTQLMYFPIQFKPDIKTTGVTRDNLRAGGVLYKGAENQGYLDGTLLTSGYTLGEYHFPRATSFLHYEPYRTVEAFLPYYGLVPLKISDIQDKYIQFRLYVDFLTGMAQYVIGVNRASVSTPRAPYCYGADDKDTRIIGTYNFQLGTPIPLTSTGVSDSMRNIVLGVGKAALSIATGALLADIPASTRTTTGTDVTKWTTRNKKTGRQITSRKKIRDTERESVTRYNNVHDAVNTAIDTGAIVLGNLAATPYTMTTNNAALNINLAQSVFIIIRQSKTTQLNYFTNARLNHLKGLPVGDTYQLKELHGFTTVSNLQLENEGFNTATSSEMGMLMAETVNGIILPEETA